MGYIKIARPERPKSDAQEPKIEAQGSRGVGVLVRDVPLLTTVTS